MGCPCENNVVVLPNSNVRPTYECTYSMEQIDYWNTLLLCAKGFNTFDAAQINSALGVVKSAKGRPDNICYFQNYLRTIEPLITQIIALGQCQ